MKKKLLIEGMCCCKCPTIIKDSLMDLGTINNVSIDENDGYAMISSDHNISDKMLIETVENSGHYRVIKIAEA